MSEVEKRRLILASSILAEDRTKTIDTAYLISAIRLKSERKLERERDITTEESLFLSSEVLVNAYNKLQSLGVKDPNGLLPKLSDFLISPCRNPYAWVVGGHVPEFGFKIVLEPPNEIQITDPRAHPAIYHEIGHFVVPQVIRKSNNVFCGYTTLSWGFNNQSRDRAGNTGYVRGVYEEPSSVIFSRLCIDPNIEVRTGYATETSFLTAMLGKLSQQLHITPLEAFGFLFRARIERDFSFQRILTEVCGKSCVKLMNQVVISLGQTKLIQAAREGGFFAEYNHLQNLMDKNAGIEFPGMNGIITRDNLIL